MDQNLEIHKILNNKDKEDKMDKEDKVDKVKIEMEQNLVIHQIHQIKLNQVAEF